MKPIINRVATSALVNLDLEDFYPSGKRLCLDVAPWLFKGLILKEKDFRNFIDQHNWNDYKNCYVALFCSADVIIPSWAYLLASSKLSNYAKLVVVGDLQLLEAVIFADIIDKIDLEIYKNKPVIIKGCSNKPIPNSAFSMLVNKLQPVVKSLMYGEACSSVPIYKRS